MSSSYLCPQVPGISWKQVENIAEYIRGTIYSEPSKVIQRGACLRLFEGGLRILNMLCKNLLWGKRVFMIASGEN